MKRIVLLRGINVGGHRRVPMAELRDAVLAAGFDDVATHIQSGNIVVTGGPGDDGEAARIVDQVMLGSFGLHDVPVVVRGPDAMTHARAESAATFPPGAADDDHSKRVHVVFLSDLPSPTRRASLDPAGFGADRFHLDIHDRVADLHVAYAIGAGSSKLSTERIERAFGVHATGRNLNTLDRVIAMLDQ